jgi:hypothetical protein
MAAWTRRGWLAVVAGAAGVLSSGCDMGSLAYFLMPEARQDARMKGLPCEDEKKAPKVAILTWSAMETRAEFIQADRQISDLLARDISELAKANKEHITFVSSRKVEDFKNNNPGWRALDMAEIGRRFGADYVICLEINNLSMYEPGGLNQLFRGRANVTVSLTDVKSPDDSPMQEVMSCVYPSDARGPISADLDVSPPQFRQAFLGHVAKKLSWYFARYPKKAGYFVDTPVN